MVKILAITQARVNSSRFPGKVLEILAGKPMLQIHLERLKRSKILDKIIVATTLEKGASEIIRIAAEQELEFYQGSTNDVLDRFYNAALPNHPEYIVRLTSDCPLIDATVIDQIIECCINVGVDYCSNTLNPTYPDGIDVEVFKFSALQEAWNNASEQSDREHVTPYIWRNSNFFWGSLFKSHSFEFSKDYSKLRLTVDEPADLELINQLVEKLGDDRSWNEYVNLLDQHSQLTRINSHIKRNEGYMKSLDKGTEPIRYISNFENSDAYRDKVHSIIPGGSHTYSKGDDQFPLLSPAAIQYGKGAHVFDIDGNKFLDCSMGLTSVSLGHAFAPVIAAVKRELDNGVNFQRPSHLELQTAEKFLGLVNGHDMIKFAKNGSIVTTAAVKLARAFTGRKLVAFPYDHPFYSYDDWFIGKTACDAGVPPEISSLSVTYKADDLLSLSSLFDQYPGQIACVISEPEKNWGLPETYLSQAIELCHNNGALYIADEMITGFKTGFPGSISKYNVVPDMATWGKGIANGFSFCALTGKREIMELGGIKNSGAEKVFLISTTHGGETHSLAAAMATIEVFETQNVVSHNHSIGNYLISICENLIQTHSLSDYITISPSNWFPIFMFRDFESKISPGLRTLAMQEMIKRGVLFQGSFCPCFSHTKEDVDYFGSALDETLKIYKSALNNGYEKYLIGEPAKPVFRKFL